MIVSENISSFDTQTISNNVLYQEDAPLTLGSNFGTIPTISLSNPSFIDDLNGTVKVNISASSFTDILSQSTPTEIVESNNLTPFSDGSSLPLTKGNRSRNRIYDLTKDFLTSEIFDGTNRIGNISGFAANRTTPGNGRSIRWAHNDGSPVNISLLQAYRLPLMGSAPINGQDEIILKDTSKNLSLGLKKSSQGQIASFNTIEVSDNNLLNIDPITFKNIDLYKQQAAYSSARFISFNSNGSLMISRSLDHLMNS